MKAFTDRQPAASPVSQPEPVPSARRRDGTSLLRVVPRRFRRRDPLLPSRRRDAFLRLLEPRRRHDWALLAAIREAYLSGRATRRLEAMARALGVDGLNGEGIRGAARELDRQVTAFRTRSLARAFPYLVIDSMSETVRDGGRVVTAAVVIVAGIATTGSREVLAVEVGQPDDPAMWSQLLSALRERGVYGVRLVTSDPHRGLELAIRQAFPGASWQRSQIGFIGATAAGVPAEQRPWLRRALRHVFAQEGRGAALAELRRITHGWGPANLAVAARVRANEEAILAFFDVPASHRNRVCATSCLAKAHRELDRHSRLIGIFPTTQSLLRLSSVLMEEYDDEWRGGPRYLGGRSKDARAAGESIEPDSLRDLAERPPALRLAS